MRRSQWQPVYERLVPFIEDVARTHYGGDKEKGFKLWAVGQVQIETDLSDDQVKEPLTLDGHSDLGLDGYYEDPETKTLMLVQSRFHGQAVAVGNGELNDFLSITRKILDPDVVVAAAARNPLAQDAHRALRDAVSKQWTLRFVFVSTGYLSPEGRTFAEVKATETEVIESREIRKDLEVYDIEGLVGLYESHLTPSRFNTDVDLEVSEGDCTQCNIGGFNVIVAAIPAKELVKAFRKFQFALFKLNPRGPLQNKVNSTILATLKDPERRKLFFHLNNGITAVCEAFRVRGDCLEIRDFQIVNGCQTTVTLAKAGAIVEAEPGIRVLLRVIEGLHHLRDDIATATNLQARLSAQDFKSNDPLQKDLKNQFNALPAPVLYEVKRGDWEMTGNPERYRDTQTGTYRRMKMKDLGQATLAFLGEPGDAKDRSRTIFEDDSTYKKVFPDGVRAEQLLLPWKVYREANKACSTWAAFPGAEYARFALTALVGLELAEDRGLPSVREAAALSSQDERIRASMNRAQQAIAGVWAAHGTAYPGHREFFRSATHFTSLVHAYRAQPS